MNIRIRVLLIDDRPTFAFVPLRHIAEFSGQLSNWDKETEIPFIHQSNTGLDLDTGSEDISCFFELMWLRNASDVNYYRKLCFAISDSLGPERLGAEDAWIPDMVFFDYALTGHDRSNALDEEIDAAILCKIVPTYRLEKIVTSEAPDCMPRLENIQIDGVPMAGDRPGLNADNLGCIGGVLTVDQFRGHPCIGVAITRKDDALLKQAGQEDGRYVEILVRDDPNQFDFSVRGNAEAINWKFLLPLAVRLLRERIVTMVAERRVTPSYADIETVASLDLESNPPPSGLSIRITDEFGMHALPLDGLFVDEPLETRGREIAAWCHLLTKSLVGNDLNLDISRAKLIGGTLWDAYISRFEDRILLSDYTFREGKLSKPEQKIFSDLKTRHCGTGDRIAEPISIDTLIAKSDTDWTARLAILITFANAWINLGKCKAHAVAKPEYAEPQAEDYIYMLFPFVDHPKDGLLLPMHKEKKKDYGSWLKSIIRKLDIQQGEWTNFETWVSAAEKQIIQAVFSEQREFLPQWITKK